MELQKCLNYDLKIICKSSVNVILLLTDLLLFNSRLVFSYILETYMSCSITSISLLRYNGNKTNVKIN